MGPATLVIGALLLMGAALCTAIALAVGGYGLFLLWPGMSMGLWSYGYLHAGPGVAGKRDDGRRHWWARIVHSPFLLVTSAVWRLAELWRREAAWSLVSPCLYVGRRVTGADALPPGTTLVVDLAAEHEEAPSIVRQVAYRSVPTLDGTSRAAACYDRVLAEAASCRGTVFVHCAAGRGRAAMFAVSLLIARGLARDVEHGIAILKARRPRIHLRPSHVRQVAACTSGRA